MRNRDCSWAEKNVKYCETENKWGTVISFPRSENKVFWVTLLTLKGNDCVFLAREFKFVPCF